MALPKGSAAYTAAEAKVQTVFQGTTLRGLLLEAYAFGTIATIALIAGISAFALAALMALLVAFGFWQAMALPMRPRSWWSTPATSTRRSWPPPERATPPCSDLHPARHLRAGRKRSPRSLLDPKARRLPP